MGNIPGDMTASAPPIKWCPSIVAKCEVLNAIFSTTKIASHGKTAHRNAARLAQADTSSSQL